MASRGKIKSLEAVPSLSKRDTLAFKNRRERKRYVSEREIRRRVRGGERESEREKKVSKVSGFPLLTRDPTRLGIDPDPTQWKKKKRE